MYKILHAEKLADQIYLMDIEAPQVTRNCLPGQFIIVKTDEKGERIPLTICDYDRGRGTVTIVFQIVGASSYKLSKFKAGDMIDDFSGPLGTPCEFLNEDLELLKTKKYLFVAGGVGAAPVYPQVKWFHEHGLKADVIIGSKTKDMLIMEDKLREAAGELFVTTDDGSFGRTGLVTEVIEDLIGREGRKYDHCVAIGPMIMMKYVCLLTKKYDLSTTVSMNPIMVDGTGMCGGCRLNVGNDVKFACVDGPEFDGHKIDFDLAMKRNQMFQSFEQEAHQHAKHEGCRCCGGEK